MTNEHVDDGGKASKHTSGPWEVANWTTSYANEVPDWNAVSVVGGGMDYVLAIVIGDAPGLDAQASARLIAAAPELLAALERADAMIDRMCTQALACGVAGTPDWDEIAGGADMFGVQDGIKAALAKARGDAE